MPIKTYTLWKDKKMELGWFEGSKTDVVRKSITWDEKKTKYKSARIDVVARAGDFVGLTIRLNYSDVVNITWGLDEDGKTKTDSGDCIGYLRNGENIFEAVMYRSPSWIFPTPDWCLFSATLVLTYEGEEPSVEPWWKKYLTWGLAGGGLVIGSVVIGSELAKKGGG